MSREIRDTHTISLQKPTWCTDLSLCGWNRHDSMHGAQHWHGDTLSTSEVERSCGCWLMFRVVQYWSSQRRWEIWRECTSLYMCIIVQSALRAWESRPNAGVGDWTWPLCTARCRGYSGLGVIRMLCTYQCYIGDMQGRRGVGGDKERTGVVCQIVCVHHEQNDMIVKVRWGSCITRNWVVVYVVSSCRKVAIVKARHIVLNTYGVFCVLCF